MDMEKLKELNHDAFKAIMKIAKNSPEINKLQEFIDDHWKERGHAFSNDIHPDYLRLFVIRILQDFKEEVQP